MRLPDDLSLEDRRVFWRNYDQWCALFPQQLVDEQLMKLSVMSIVEEAHSPRRDYNGKPMTPRPPYGLHRALGQGHAHHRFYFGDSGWYRDEMVPCELYMVPAKYQSTKHTEMIEPIMHALYPWLAEFKCSFYSLNFYPNHTEEFYVRTTHEYGPRGGHCSLYVPYKAFMTHDIAAIERRNASYLREYTKGEATWNAMREDANVVAFLLQV